jgi:hypothetical protein
MLEIVRLRYELYINPYYNEAECPEPYGEWEEKIENITKQLLEICTKTNPERLAFYSKVEKSFICVKIRWTEIRETGNLVRKANDPRLFPLEIMDRHYG